MCPEHGSRWSLKFYSIWFSEQLLEELGHEVIVANVLRELRAISHSDRKSDTVDAEKDRSLCPARSADAILRPISHRTVAQQEALTLIHCPQPDRSSAGQLAWLTSVRGLAKPCGLSGFQLRPPYAFCWMKRSAWPLLPPGLAVALGPVLEQIAAMTVTISKAVRPHHQATHVTGIFGDAGAASESTASKPAHCVDVCADSGKQRTLQAKSRCGLLPRPAGRDAASPGTATRNLVLPRLETSTSDLSWLSAPTMCSGRVEGTRRYDSGVCIWLRVEASSPTIVPSLPLLAS